MLLLVSLALRLGIFRYSKIIQLFCLVILHFGCGENPAQPDHEIQKPSASYASDLMPLVSAYEADAALADAPIVPEFRRQLVQVVWEEDLGQQGAETILGRCERFNENHPDPTMRFRIVKIRKPDAQGYVGQIKLDALTLKTVVYHELGHCLHDFRGHLPENARQIMSHELPKERFQSFPQLLHQHFSLFKSEQ